MIEVVRWAGILMAAWFAGWAWAAPLPPLRDADGRPALLGTPATRIVTTAPSLAELVFAAGAGDKLVGVSAYSDFPQPVRSLPIIGDSAGISIESLLSLRPDLVLTWKGGTRESDVQRIQALHIPVFAIDIVQLSDVPKALRAIGQLVGRAEAAELTAGLFERRVDAVRTAHRGKAPVATFFELSATPLMTINRHHFIAETIRLCRGVNVFDGESQMVFTPSREALLARNVDLVLTAGSSADAGNRYRGLAAQRRGMVLPLTADYILRPGPRLLYAVDEVCSAIDRARGLKLTP
ncbi:MAG: ABC transporter substrate-binding protein [Betaproteobacteria bacterium]|nr:ABC transporter substrate-binding protein [Betaproteobacteria bacterium]